MEVSRLIKPLKNNPYLLNITVKREETLVQIEPIDFFDMGLCLSLVNCINI